MRYSSGNYESFASSREGLDTSNRKAYIVGSGLASLATACFLVRDGKMEGENIHILEKATKAGGACSEKTQEDVGYILEGGRDLDVHFECFWDLVKSIPSKEIDGSILDEIYWLNKKDPCKCLVRATENRGETQYTDMKYNLSDGGAAQVIKLFLTPDAKLFDKKIEDVLTKEVLDSDFWLYWSTTFGFNLHHSALELKRYLQRFVYDFDGILDQTTIQTMRYNTNSSLIEPIMDYLKENKVNFHYGAKVVDAKFNIDDNNKYISSLKVIGQGGEEEEVKLTEKDFAFITLGGASENASYGSQSCAPTFNGEFQEDGGWQLWRNIAVQDVTFGNPDKFCRTPEESMWVTATITTLDNKIPPYIKSIARRDPFSGSSVTGGYIVAKDSPWKISWTFGRQPQFKDQKEDQLVGWMYGLYPMREGAFVKKRMVDCTGKEIAMEWLYHLGVEESQIEELAENSANTVPVVLPFLASYFHPRAIGDRPRVIPREARNFAFIGQFARTKKETMFTLEYSVRTAMEAVYTLLELERAVPMVWGGLYDLRDVLSALSHLRDGKSLMEINAGLKEKKILKDIIKAGQDTDIYTILEKYGIIQ